MTDDQPQSETWIDSDGNLHINEDARLREWIERQLNNPKD